MSKKQGANDRFSGPLNLKRDRNVTKTTPESNGNPSPIERKSVSAEVEVATSSLGGASSLGVSPSDIDMFTPRGGRKSVSEYGLSYTQQESGESGWGSGDEMETTASSKGSTLYEGLGRVVENIKTTSVLDKPKFTPQKPIPATIASSIGHRVFKSTPLKNKYKEWEDESHLSPATRIQKLSQAVEKSIKGIYGDEDVGYDAAVFSNLYSVCQKSASSRMLHDAVASSDPISLESILSEVVAVSHLSCPQYVYDQYKSHIVCKCFRSIISDVNLGLRSKLKPELEGIDERIKSASSEWCVDAEVLKATWNTYKDLKIAKCSRKELSQTALSRKFYASEACDKVKYFTSDAFKLQSFTHALLELLKVEYRGAIESSVQKPLSCGCSDNQENSAPTLLVHTKQVAAQTRYDVDCSQVCDVKLVTVVRHSSALNVGTTEVCTTYATGSKVSVVPSLGTYHDIGRELSNYVRGGVESSRMVSTIFNIINDRTTVNLCSTKEESDDVLQYLQNVTYLLFSTEVRRDTASLVTHAMFLDLVSSGDYNFTEMATKLPMAAVGAVKAARTIREIVKNAIPDYRRYDEMKVECPSINQVAQMFMKTNKIMTDWLAKQSVVMPYPFPEGDRELLSSVVKKIEEAVPKWFGITLRAVDLFPVEVDDSVVVIGDDTPLSASSLDAA